MIISSITLNNFRQFTGEQTINFSTDSNKKVTIITADSGVGKTTLIRAFQWALYGECGYDNILNAQIKKDLDPNEETNVSIQLKLEHNKKQYTIKRTQRFHKSNVRVDCDSSILTVNYIENGIDQQYRNRDAIQIIKNIMPKDLFKYFFLEGETLKNVGKEMSSGKTSLNQEFADAVRGLLGFNYLYEAQKHLSKVSKYYSDQIASDTSSTDLKNNIRMISQMQMSIETNNEKIKTLREEEEYYNNKRQELNDKIVHYAAAEEKQKRAKALESEMNGLFSKIKAQKELLFKCFSSDGYSSLLCNLLDDVEDTLKHSDAIDQGIPGINADAVKYMLEHHQCICGEYLEEGSEHWNMLQNWLTYLPPNNIGYELKTFRNNMAEIRTNGAKFDEDFKNKRKYLSDLVNQYNADEDELRRLTEEISNVHEDIAALKKEEKEYIDKLGKAKWDQDKLLSDNEESDKKILNLQKIQEDLKKADKKTYFLQMCQQESDYLRSRISSYCTRKEAEKKEKLKDAINTIFKEFYDEKIIFTLDSNYGIQIKTMDNDILADFTSGGQDIALALAFISAIIKLNSEKSTAPDELGEVDEKEIYPLVMDAPTSNFGMKQMRSFSDLMPKITDQIIIFFNDKDGPILEQTLKNEIGSKWSIRKIDTYHGIIEKE